MKPSDRQENSVDFLGQSFVTFPYKFLSTFSTLDLTAHQFVVLMQILGSSQVQRQDFMSPQQLAGLCSMTVEQVSDILRNLIDRGYLTIGQRLDDDGTHSNYFDLKPLWDRLRGKPVTDGIVPGWRKDTVSLFEEEFGRPLSGLECDQIRTWLSQDNYPEWLVTEALREAVLANKYSFKYIDRVLYDWQRNRIRTKQELDAYRQSYRERFKGKEEVAATQKRKSTGGKGQNGSSATRDERYSAFYELFPDS